MAVHNIAVELAADHAAAQDESPMRLSHESHGSKLVTKMSPNLSPTL
jgi:hypothetical protein